MERIAVGIAVEYHHFQGRKSTSGIAVGKVGNHFQKFGCHVHAVFAKAAGILKGALQQLCQILCGKRLQHKHFAAGEQSAVDFKRGIFGSGTDEDNAAFFHKGQKSILLRLVEAVNFVYKNNGFFAESTIFFCLLHDLADFLDAAGDGRKIDECGFGLPAMMRASVVLPTPGGPQKIMEEMRSFSISRRSTLPSPNRCCWPTNSSSVRGRRRAASG